ncbi:ATP-binding protein [Streptomyces sp. NPDC059816]|uniref:sensor histidine kinase n=1 Tax=Streptomyces sp. NPDC059816 TaxID=3346960 RepID=UPI0036696797
MTAPPPHARPATDQPRPAPATDRHRTAAAQRRPRTSTSPLTGAPPSPAAPGPRPAPPSPAPHPAPSSGGVPSAPASASRPTAPGPSDQGATAPSSQFPAARPPSTPRISTPRRTPGHSGPTPTKASPSPSIASPSAPSTPVADDAPTPAFAAHPVPYRLSRPTPPVGTTAPRAATGPVPARPRPLVSALCGLLTLLLAAAAAVVAARTAPADARGAVALGGAAAGALLLAVALALVHHALRTATALRAHLAAARAETDRAHDEAASLADDLAGEHARHGAELRTEQARAAAAVAAERDRLHGELARERELLAVETDRLAELADRAATDRAATLAACANAAGRLQALATGTLADLRRMEDEHGDENVLADLLHIDHRTAQTGRLADSIALLTGARSGRRWARPIVMESILRGAMGRISAYQRVHLHSTSETAVAGHAAEGVMHALAELLDNAANFSPPNAEVHVYVEEVPAGAVISVEDSGLVMSDHQLRRAERAVSGDSSELGGLSGNRLGLAVVGRLARKHGLTVSFRPSARGGTGVVMMVPRELLTGPDAVPARYAGLPPAQPPSYEDGPVPVADGPAHRSRPELAPADEVQPASVPPHPLSFSYAAARGLAEDGVDPEPLPPHGQPGGAEVRPGPDHRDPAPVRAPAATARPQPLPRRPRGRTLPAPEARRAEAERPGAADPVDVAARAARFSSFRAAVRPAPPTPDPAPAPPAHQVDGPHHQEGDTTR